MYFRIAFLASALTLACTPAATPAGPTPTAAPTAPSPMTSPSPAVGEPVGYTLPSECRIAGSPSTETAGPSTSWEFDCGSANNGEAVEFLTPSFAQQGWALCKQGQGRGFWAKGATQTIVSQSASGLPLLTQLPRQPDDCP